MPVLKTPKRHKSSKNANHGVEFFAHTDSTLSPSSIHPPLLAHTSFDIFENYTIKSALPSKQLAMFPRTARERIFTTIVDDYKTK
jgi:hypothetical protein